MMYGKAVATLSVMATSALAASPVIDGTVVVGESSHYGGNLAGGTCSFNTLTLPAGMFGTAFSGQAWESSGVCGACVEVTGPNGNTIKAMVRHPSLPPSCLNVTHRFSQVVDQCPECPPSKLDLFINAFSELADPGVGIVPISYTFIPCGIESTPLVLRNKSGTSPYWFSMQVFNANEPVEKLEVSTDGGATWRATTRQPYNFFEESSGFGTQSVDVRVTSSMGSVVVVEGVSVAADLETPAGSNF